MNEFNCSAEVPPSIVSARPSRRDPVVTRHKWVEQIERFRSPGAEVAFTGGGGSVLVPTLTVK